MAPSANDSLIAYFSAEYAIEPGLPLYAGGLGVLAADYLLQAGASGLPVIGFGMLYKEGFVTTEHERVVTDPVAVGYELVCDGAGKVLTVDVALDKSTITIQAWRKTYGSAQLILLDSAVASNSREHQRLMSHLYDPEFAVKAKQEWVFGLACVALLEKLDIQPTIYHLNEGHTAFVIAGLLLKAARNGKSLAQAQAIVRRQVVATKHTILDGAGIYIDQPFFESLTGPALRKSSIIPSELFSSAQLPTRPTDFSTTHFLTNHARRVSGVSAIHVAREHAQDKTSRMITVTNGVYAGRWEDAAMAEVRDGAELWRAQQHNKQALISYVNDQTGSSFTSAALTLVWARRIAPYKRPTLVFNDMARLRAILCHQDRPIQLILAGKANVDDPEAIALFKMIEDYMQAPGIKGQAVHLPHYSLESAKLLVGGSDIWLNTPIRGYEACGTSGMKAGMNASLQVSVSDGWVDEVAPADIGWVLPEADETTTAAALYDLLEHTIAPLFYKRDANGLPASWLAKSAHTKQFVRQAFGAERMIKDYQTKLYS